VQGRRFGSFDLVVFWVGARVQGKRFGSFDLVVFWMRAQVLTWWFLGAGVGGNFTGAYRASRKNTVG
jgi:hypothetical protein